MELALGTVQFGLRYGIAGPDKAVAPREARAILCRAHELGIRTLDTAPAYGDIEARLAALTDGLTFAVVSKLPPCPPDLDGDRAAARWIVQRAQDSLDRLGSGLQALLFHRAEDLLEARANVLWQAASAFAAEHGLKLGVSCYDPATLARVRPRFPVALTQLPGNALDQRWREGAGGNAAPLEVHLRSAFLQGLLLMPERLAAQRVPSAAQALGRWHAWCGERGLPPLTAALGLVKGLPDASHCVVGVDDMRQLESIAAAWAAAPELHAPELASHDLTIIDPRRWAAAA